MTTKNHQCVAVWLLRIGQWRTRDDLRASTTCFQPSIFGSPMRFAMGEVGTEILLVLSQMIHLPLPLKYIFSQIFPSKYVGINGVNH